MLHMECLLVCTTMLTMMGLVGLISSPDVQAAYSRGDISTEAFVEQFLTARKLFHQRDLKCMAARQTILT